MEESNQVVIVGGTHGNERTGIQLVRRLRANPSEMERSSFKARTLLANEEAILRNSRYLEQDLNRCFTHSILNNEPENVEQERAHIINKHFGPKGDNTSTDWIIDLHTTTSNMGVTLIVLQQDPMALDMALYIQQQMPGASIFCQAPHSEDDPFLCSVARHGFQIEVGPVAQGLLRWDVFELTQQALKHALDFIDLHNRNQLNFSSPREADVFEFIEKIHLPRNENGGVIGMIHPELQDKDYHQLSPGDPIFILDTGETILFEYPEPVYVAFVNEAAYYDQSHAVSLMRKRKLSWE